MNKKTKTFSHEQLAHWLNEGLDLARIGFAVFDEKGYIIFENEHCLKMGGCPFQKKISPADKMSHEPGIQEDIVQTGSHRWTKTIRRVFPDNTTICTCIDLSDQKMAEFARSENEKKYRLLADNTLDVIWLMDMNMRFEYVNPAIEQMLGFSVEEWTGTNLADHCTPEEMERMGKIVIQAMERADKKPWVLFETELLSKNSTLVPVEILAKFLFDKDGAITGIQGTTRDIRERRESEATRQELENLLIQAQKFEALGALAGGIAHDFNNILSAIIGFSELALEDSPENSDLRENVKQVQIAGNRARELVMQILTMARQSETEIQPVPIDRIAKEAMKLLDASLPRTIAIKSDIVPNTYVLADPIQVHQILMNLCTNASHAMREKGGTLTIEIKRVDLDNSSCAKPKNIKKGEYVMMAVSDTGSGIADDLITKIFEPYFTTKPEGEGTGIGLSVIKSIINKLNGLIEVNSTPGEGSTFTVFLPATEEKPKPRPITDEMLVGGTERILFIDDEPSIAALGEQILRRMGYRVTSSENSSEALDLLIKNHQDFDLIISDITMPGTTGDELARHALKLNPGIPVILCTGFSDRVSEEKIKQMGVRALLRKPLSRTVLLNTVRSVLDGKDIPLQ